MIAGTWAAFGSDLGDPFVLSLAAMPDGSALVAGTLGGIFRLSLP